MGETGVTGDGVPWFDERKADVDGEWGDVFQGDGA